MNAHSTCVTSTKSNSNVTFPEQMQSPRWMHTQHVSLPLGVWSLRWMHTQHVSHLAKATQVNSPWTNTISQMNTHSTCVSPPWSVISLSRSRVCYLSSLLTYALIKLNPKTATPPQNMLWMHGMQKCRSFKIIASRLKRCSNWCCHVYIATHTSASKCLRWPNETKYGI
jgi:hypothetical protein